MSKQLKKEEKKPVSICGVRQNCYRVGTTGERAGCAKTPIAVQKSYVSLEKKMLPNGYVQDYVEKDYPITSESVTSFADGADYRNDPAQAIANAPQRVNLGDVTETQKFMENPQNYARLFKEVSSKLDRYFASQKQAQTQEQAQIQQNQQGGNE